MFPANEALMCPAVDAPTQREEERMRRLDVAREAVALAEMTLAELRERYRDVFGEECRSRHKGFLRRRILWGLQALAEHALSFHGSVFAVAQASSLCGAKGAPRNDTGTWADVQAGHRL